MLNSRKKLNVFLVFMLVLVSHLCFTACSVDSKRVTTSSIPTSSFPIEENTRSIKELVPQQYYVVEQSVKAGDYFEFIETLIAHLDSTNTSGID